MLCGQRAGLRARQGDDVAVLHADLYDDVDTRVRASGRAWAPISPDLEESPFGLSQVSDDLAVFSIVDLATGDLAGAAQMWGIDLHNRTAHLGLSLRPAFRGRGLATDTVAILVHYGFVVRGLHRLSLETLADNEPMIRAATRAGFVPEGTLRAAAWVNGRFVDDMILGLLATDPRPDRPAPRSGPG